MKIFSAQKRNIVYAAILCAGLILTSALFLSLTQNKSETVPPAEEKLPTTTTSSAALTNPIVSGTEKTPLPPQRAPSPTISKTAVTSTPSKEYWQPNSADSFDWLFESSLANAADATVDIYSADTFDVTKATIDTLHKQGKRVVCYINFGAWEDWRSDKEFFNEDLLGKNYIGWDGERWLDISNPKIRPLMQKRLDLAKAKGCDGIDPDNIDSYNADTGFAISFNDQISYNLWLANEAHRRGMSIGLKNGAELIAKLGSSYDWALIEDCADQGWCDSFKTFTTKGKAVFQVEYTDTNIDFTAACRQAQKNNFRMVLKKRTLDAWSKFCA